MVGRRQHVVAIAVASLSLLTLQHAGGAEATVAGVTPAPTNAPTATATPRATSTPARLALGDDDSCAVVTPARGAAWLLAPLLPLAWLRRRSNPA